jgi:hypothetical protein
MKLALRTGNGSDLSHTGALIFDTLQRIFGGTEKLANGNRRIMKYAFSPVF